MTNNRDEPRRQSRVLLVTGDEEAIGAIVGTSEDLGCRVEVHRQSGSALMVLYHNPWHYDLVIADEDMDDLPGSDLARRLLSLRSTAEVILLVPEMGADATSKARAAGVLRFVAKPVTREELLKAVKDALGEFRFPVLLTDPSAVDTPTD